MSAAKKGTPGPFVVDYNTAELPFRAYSKSTQSNVAYFHSEADAESFVRACNAHDDLVKALEIAYRRSCERAESNVKWTQKDQEAHEAISAALAKATEGQQ